MSDNPTSRLGANALLQSLPEAERERLTPYFRIVELVAGTQLYAADESLAQLYFPLEGTLARMLVLPSGESVQVGFVGTDGVAGISLALGGATAIGSVVVQRSGNAAALGAVDFTDRVRKEGSPLFDTLLAYANLQLHVVSQFTACHSLHRIEQRLCCYMLRLQDCSENGSIAITHDTLADYLGVHRPSITYALQELSAQGLICARRRSISIRDRAGLLERSCECYGLIREITAREMRRICRIGTSGTSSG